MQAGLFCIVLANLFLALLDLGLTVTTMCLFECGFCGSHDTENAEV